MPIVTIQQFPRDLAQKRELAKRITDAFCDVYGTDPVSVQVFFQRSNPGKLVQRRPNGG